MAEGLSASRKQEGPRRRFLRRRVITERRVSTVLKWAVKQAVQGMGPFASAVALADDFAHRHADPEEAINALIRSEMVKIGATGFLMGLPGAFALPLILPASLSTDYLVGARLVAAIAHLRGWDVSSESVQKFVLLCLMGNHGKEIIKQSSRVTGVKAAQSLLQSVTGQLVSALPRAAGFRMASRFWEKGAVTLTRAAPIVGGVIGGGIDAAFLAICAQGAKEIFSPNQSGLMASTQETPHDFFELNGRKKEPPGG